LFDRYDEYIREQTMIGNLIMEQTLVTQNDSYLDTKPANEIFVVDDDEDMQEILAAALASEGFPVTAFKDGEEFLRATKTRVPLCVFLDVVMPGKSGLEILSELRARHYWTPIFLTSARDDFPTVVEALKNGAHDYIRKPFSRDAPAVRLRSAIELWSNRANGAIDTRMNENCEWFRLTPSEKETVLLMRLMNS
jgi:FixJ family two-component response regulator